MIELKNVTYKVVDNGKEKIILDNISCVFQDGEMVAITGQNGGGKSTITKLIVGILKPNKGKIFYNHQDITNMSIDERANLGINYAYQQPVTFKGLTVKDLIDIATHDTNSVPKACEYLSRVGLCAKEYIGRIFDSSLSGGEQKRIEIALALAKKGETIIFDEPEAGIDLWSFDRLNNLFKDKRTYIIVSHQEKVLEKADKIMVINGGRIVQYEGADTVLKNLGKGVCGKISGGKR